MDLKGTLHHKKATKYLRNTFYAPPMPSEYNGLVEIQIANAGTNTGNSTLQNNSCMATCHPSWHHPCKMSKTYWALPVK